MYRRFKRGLTFILTVTILSGIMTPMGALAADNAANDIKTEKSIINKYDDVKIPAVPKEHPRLFLTNKDIPQIKANLNNPLLKGAWERVAKNSKVHFNGVLPKPKDEKVGNYNNNIRVALEDNALIYILEGNKEAGQIAASGMINFLSTVKFPIKKDVTRDVGKTILTAGIVYDWCYDLLNEDMKKDFIKYMVQLGELMEIGYPPSKQGAVVGHGGEAQLMRDLLGAGIAVYDEYPDLYRFSAGRFFKEFIPVREFFYGSGMHHQGDSYGLYRYQWEMFAQIIFDRLGAGEVFSQNQSTIPYRNIYTRRADGQMLRDGDSYHSVYKTLGTYWSDQTPFMLSASYYKDPILMGEFLRQYSYERSVEDIWMILFFNPSVKTASYSQLPLTKYYGEPMGSMVARTGWTGGMNSSDVVAEMKIGNYWFSNHQHLDAGQFQIYYKGGLAIDSGLYEGKNGQYGSDHDKNYHKRTIAHNSILVNDPKEDMYYYSTIAGNDGGQFFPNKTDEPDTLENLLQDGYEIGKVTGQQFGPDEIAPDFSYIKGNISKAYSNKVKDMERSFVFLNLKDDLHPASMMIFDRVVSSNEAFKKTWLLHSIEEPLVANNVTTIARSANGYNGKLVNHTLLPETGNVNIEKVGGKGREFEVNGKNYPQVPNAKDTSEESGAWRVEVSPQIASTTDYFFNVLQVMDNKGGPEALQVQKLDSGNFVGAKIKDRVVFFNKNTEKEKGRIYLTFDGNNDEVYKCLVSDLVEGCWSVRKGNETGKLYEVTKEGGVLYFDGTPGTYIIEPKGKMSKVSSTILNTKKIKPDLQIDKKVVNLKAQPIFQDNILMVPVVELLEKIGVKVDLDSSNGKLKASKEKTVLEYDIKKDILKINGVTKTLEGPSLTIDGVLYIPASFLNEVKWVKYKWDSFMNRIILKVLDSTLREGALPIKVLTTSGLEPDVELLAVDGDPETRWAVEGDGEWLMLDLGEATTVGSIGVMWYKGNVRNTKFDMLISADGIQWTTVYSGNSSGKTNAIEKITIDPTQVRYVKVVGHGNSENSMWNSINEIMVYPN